jgi:hypothetical protein
MSFMSSYHILVLNTAIFISYGLSLILLSLLAKHFFSWFKLNHNLVVLVYALAISMISINAAITIIYINTQLNESPHQDYIRPVRSLTGSFTKVDVMYGSAYVLTSVLSFILIWIATVLLLRHYSRRLGKIKCWIVVSIPLVYFLSQFQSLFLYSFADLRLSNPVLFGIIYNLIFSISKPAGGVLFGIAFWTVAKRLTSKTVKSYMMISAYGIMLLFTVNQPTGLTLVPYPPFGLTSICFMVLASYLVSLGVYSSATSVYEGSRLRIGTAQMEQELQTRVIAIYTKTKNSMIKETGISF